MPNANVRDADFELLKMVAERTNQSQAETVSQSLILYAESLGLIKTTERKIEVIKRTYEMADQPWAAGEPTGNAH